MNKQLIKRSSTNQWLKEVEMIILARINDPNLTIPQIARKIFMSERQFYRRIKGATGKTPNQYLRNLRMKKAHDILNNSQPDSIKEVALSVGYCRTDYFSQLYESVYGIRPMHYLE